ncbi:MAG: cell wall-active antibiotics response protein [bacterium]|nr:cell wall-active antibiotics response protein [bacterium]
MSPEKKFNFSTSLAGLLLVALGTLWILNNLDVLDFRIREWWPLILIAIGLVQMAHHRRILAPGGWFMIFLGGVFLLTTNHIVEWKELWKYWPVLIIFVGLSIVFGGRCGCMGRVERMDRRGYRTPSSDSDTGKSYVSGSVIFGSLERTVSSKEFKGGSVSAIFGGIEIDLRGAGLHEKGAVLHLSTIFGGAEIRIPETWIIELDPTAILGGVSKKASNEERSSGKRLVIKASAVFGSVDIKN